MFDLDNITVEELYLLPPEKFKYYMDLENVMLINDDIFIKRKARSLGSLSYGDVGSIKISLRDPSIDNIFEIFRIIYGIKEKDILGADVISYFYALKYVKKAIMDLLDSEKKALSSDPDPLLEMAGIKRLSILGEMTTLIRLGRSFGKSPEEIEEWKYNLVFAILVNDKISGEVEKEYRNLNKQKI